MVSPYTNDHSEDLALRDRILSGDASAADDFFERYLNRVCEFVHYRMGPSSSQSEDVVQETFVSALESLASFDGRSSLYTWLCGIAKNKISSLRRKRRPMALADVLDEADTEIDAILSRIESEEIPDELLDAQETRDLVGATLSSLPDDYRDALLRKYFEGATVAQIGSETGRSTKATESLLHRSRTAFSKIFELLARRRGGLV